MMVTLFDDHASILETLILAVRSRGIRISTLLVDRGFNGADVVNKLKQLKAEVSYARSKTQKGQASHRKLCQRTDVSCD